MTDRLRCVGRRTPVARGGIIRGVPRVVPALVSLALVGAVLSPLARAPTDDGFPLSTYPMFAVPREPRETLTYAYGLTATGERRVLSPDAIGSHEVMQAFALLQVVAVRGPDDARGLACAIATRTRGSDIAEIRISSATFDAIGYFAHGAPGDGELELARCEVPR